MIGSIKVKRFNVCWKMFYKIQNADGKCWLMPMRDVRMAMALYQPSGWKGRLLKQLFPYLHWSKVVRKMLKIEVVEYDLSEELREVICRAFGVDDFRYSVFCGTPSVHQKTTMQVWRGDKILGYVKLTESEEVRMLFEREANFLKEIIVNSQQSTVNSQQILTPSATLVPLRQGDNIEGQQLLGQVPMVEMVRCGALFVLLQTTRKTLKSKVVHEWGALQENFLKRLYDAAAKEMVWEESDLAKSLELLKTHLDWLPDGVDRIKILEQIDDVVGKYRGTMVDYSAYHGDFTPWNMFVEKGELFVFDWEYVGKSYPKGLDRYHFWMQTAIFEKHWGVEELEEYIGSAEGKWIDRDMLKLYLLDVMSRYVMREGRKVKELGLFGVWGELL